jgi:hypothetical protein
MMKGMNYKLLLGLAVLPLLCMAATTPVQAQAPQTPSATFSCETKSVVIGIGFTWGSCTLNYQGHTCPFKFDGFSMVGLGISSAALSGKAYNLKNLVDFAGGYKAAGVGLTVIAGGGTARLKNGAGVVMEIGTQTTGAKFEIGGGGVTVSLDSSCFQG